MELSAVERLNMKERETVANEWLTAEEAAEALNLNKSQIHYRGRTGKLETRKEGRRVLFRIRLIGSGPSARLDRQKTQPDEVAPKAGGISAETRALLKALSKGKGRSREGERALRAWKKAGMPDIGECPTCGKALTN